MDYHPSAKLNMYANQMRVLQQLADTNQQFIGRSIKVKNEGTFDSIGAYAPTAQDKQSTQLKSEFHNDKSQKREIDCTRSYMSRARQSTRGNRFNFTLSEDALL